ncbi:MAG: DNA mismatch repair protein MutS [Clostridiales bacterium]|nr:DNA mismatch repair protein MutS [Clostridiales bacterium]
MLSPMMKQYLKLKEKYPDTIILYRLGDFYEMFFEDAEVVSRELELTLTGRDCGLEKRAPMCGMPHHAANTYIARLIANGHKVAICEQLSDPKTTKGIVERDIVQIITPGTVIDNDALDAKRNNFLMAVYSSKNSIAVCYGDISTGFIETTELVGDDKLKLLDDVLARVKPAEVLCNLSFKAESNNLSAVKLGYVPEFYPDESLFEYAKAKNQVIEQFNINSLSALGLQDKKEMTTAVGAVLLYFAETQKRLISNIKKLSIVQDSRFVHLDILARKNLELVQSNSLNTKKGSLLWLLDRTKTAMGGRLIKSFIDQPLRDEVLINERLDSVEELSRDLILRNNILDALNGFTDIERKCSKISAGNISPKECLSLCESLKKLPEIKSLLMSCSSKMLRESGEAIADMSDIQKVLADAIDPDAPANLKDGGYILASFNEELYKLRNAGEYGKQWLAEYEIEQKEKTGIKFLKTGYNRVFGYYIEVSNTGVANVPDNYIRKQTITNGERYITPELKEMEYKILNSKEQAIELESKIYGEIKTYLASYIGEFAEIAKAVALADCLISLADVANEYGYVRPVVSNDINHIKIVDGRHPVVEAMMDKGAFSPNDTLLDGGENRTMLITGPNMAGKSTYMRQVAIITLMAHIGSFVPAKSAEISIIDRVFTRVGASDDLAFGQSTFMVEMSEVSNIINNATDKSLIILDEVGRGTSTYDGMSIAASIIEYLSKHLNAKTLFSTHYHELTDMEGRVDGVKNYRVMVKEWDGDIVFLHKIARGSANRSFGIEVAKLSGLPKEIISRAKEILTDREETGSKTPVETNGVKIDTNANVAEVINVLKEMDMDNISPIMAFGTLQNLVDKVKK